jgi:hypothetical protein
MNTLTNSTLPAGGANMRSPRGNLRAYKAMGAEKFHACLITALAMRQGRYPMDRVAFDAFSEACMERFPDAVLEVAA